MPTTIYIGLDAYSAEAVGVSNTLKIVLKSEQNILNTGGDFLDHKGNGWFEATIAETIANIDYRAVIERMGVGIADGVLFAGQTVVGVEASGGGGEGSGRFLCKFTIRDSLNRLVPYCDVVATESSAGDSIEVYTSGVANSAARVELNLAPGTYYLWRNKASFQFTDPVEIEVSESGVVTLP